MKRAQLRELHYITPIENVRSILTHGILCNVRARRLRPVSVADPAVQDSRERRRVPGGLELHRYVNLYFTARNPMMYKRQAQHRQLCVLRVSPEVLDLAGVVITDGNAASDYTAFRASPAGLEALDEKLVFARYWTDPDQVRAYHKRRVKCAEVLVPEVVGAEHVLGIYVSCEGARNRLLAEGITLPIEINPDLFFQT